MNLLKHVCKKSVGVYVSIKSANKYIRTDSISHIDRFCITFLLCTLYVGFVFKFDFNRKVDCRLLIVSNISALKLRSSINIAQNGNINNFYFHQTTFSVFFYIFYAHHRPKRYKIMPTAQFRMWLINFYLLSAI